MDSQAPPVVLIVVKYSSHFHFS